MNFILIPYLIKKTALNTDWAQLTIPYIKYVLVFISCKN